ncbi:AAA family ATPase [Planotetraspora thailandica]|uniref:helix-turn-helix transcriptional regulator n=1 Tax=Planotetraspora thailandica TaxID=487172 RepID=UPI0019508BAE|nr:AAA family ATPase [Planotetraspora thailandica]
MGGVRSQRLVGRERELAVLWSLADDLAAGKGRALWIEGEAGIGKSALCDALASEVAQAGIPVVRAVAQELLQPFPLRPVIQALSITTSSADPLRREIAELLSGGDDRVFDAGLAAAERTLELIDRHCAAGPMMLAFEDLHWADPPTAMLWERLAETVDQMPLLLVGSCRPYAQRPELQRLRDAVDFGAATVVRPQPLDMDDVLELAASLLGRAPDEALAAGLADTGGNPLYAQELVAGWNPEAPDARPGSLTAAITRRLALLGAPTREVLRSAALLGEEFAVPQLAAVIDRRPAELVDTLAEALADGTLIAVDDRLAFRHELVRSVLEEQLAPPLRAGLHAQFAAVLAGSGADVDVVARHLLAGGGTLDRWAVQWLAELPEAALLAAPGAALELLGRALRSPAAAGWLTPLGVRLAVVSFAVGQDDECEAAAAEVASADDPEVRGRMLLYRVRAASRQGRTAQALDVAAAAVNDPRIPALWSTRIRSRAAGVLAKEGRHTEAQAAAVRALSDATALADRIAVAYSRLVLAHTSGPEEALSHLEDGLTGLGWDAESNDLRMLLLNNKLACLNNLGRPEAFRAAVHESLIVGGRVGAGRIGRVETAAAMGSFDFGDWDEAMVHLDAMPPAQQPGVTMVRHGLTALIAAHREDWVQARHHIAAVAGLPITAGDVRILSGYLVAARAIRAEADGDLPGAVAELSVWLDPDMSYDAKERYMWLPDLVRLALAVADADTARAAADSADADASASSALPRQITAAELCRALLDDDVPAIRRTAEVAAQRGWLLLAAAAHEEAAVRLAATGDLSPTGDLAAARETLNEAARIYASLGATWDLRRADARLRTHGIRRGPRSLHRRSATGWDALTPTEQRVASLVADGLSNPEIANELYMSRRTAQTHVSRVLRKLDVSSRMDLMRSVHRTR